MKLQLKISLVFVIAILVMNTSVFAQKDVERRVYYLDITESMKGWDGQKYIEANNIWPDVTEKLKTAINCIKDTTTEIMVVTFTDNNHPVTVLGGNRVFRARPSEKSELCSAIDGIETIKKCHTDIYVPFRDFYNYRISPSRVSCFFLMTDGVQKPNGNSALQQEIERWSTVTDHGEKNIYGWYLMLNQAARSSDDIKHWIGDSTQQNINHLWAVEDADVNLNLVRFRNCFNSTIDIRKDSLICIPFKYCPAGVGLRVSVEGANENYEVGQPQISSDRKQLMLIIKPQRGKKLSGIQPQSTLRLKFELTAKPKYTWLMTDKISIVCKNNLSPSLTNIYFDKKKKESTILGKLKRYPSLCSLSKDTVGIVDTLFFSFDDDAIAKGNLCCARFQLVDEKGDSISFSRMIDGDKGEYSCSQFKVTPLDSFKVFRFLFNSLDADDGIYQVRIKLMGVDSLKSVVNCPMDSFVNKPIIASYTIEYDKNCNPIWWWLFWLLLLILAIVAAIILTFLTHRLLAPKFPEYAQLSFESGLDTNIGMWPCMYKNTPLSSAANQTPSNILLTHALHNYCVKEIIITSKKVSRCQPDSFKFLSKEWLSQKWYGDAIFISGDFRDYTNIIDEIRIVPKGRLKPSASIFINKSLVENGNLEFYKLLESDNPHPVSVDINTSVQIQCQLKVKTFSTN